MKEKKSGSVLILTLYIFSILILALNLRSLFPSTAALLPEITTALGLSKSQAGYLTTLPVICMGVFAPLAPKLGQKIGVERSLLLVLLIIGLGLGVRGYLDSFGLFLGTALAGSGIAVGNVLLPSLVKRDFSHQAALMTGLYTMSLVGGAALAAAITLPLATSFDNSWEIGLQFWGGLAFFAMVIWAPVALISSKKIKKSSKNRKIQPVKGLYKDKLAWAVTLFMGIQSAIAFCVMGWMSPMLRNRGFDGAESGFITSVSIFIQVGSSLLVPLVAVKFKNQKIIAVILSIMSVAGIIGIILLPASLVWPAAILQGVGHGGFFALCLLLIVLRSEDSNVAAHLSSMSQTLGYILAAIGPFFVGILYERTGSFSASALFFGLIGIGSIVSGLYAGRNEFVKVEVVK